MRYIDAAVLRDRDADKDPGQSLEERLYYCQDANFNTVALVTPAGSAVERYVYDPYGRAKVFDVTGGTWQERTDWSQTKQNEIRYCGYRWDADVGLYLVRRRQYDVSVGRWL